MRRRASTLLPCNRVSSLLSSRCLTAEKHFGSTTARLAMFVLEPTPRVPKSYTPFPSNTRQKLPTPQSPRSRLFMSALSQTLPFPTSNTRNPVLWCFPLMFTQTATCPLFASKMKNGRTAETRLLFTMRTLCVIGMR